MYLQPAPWRLGTVEMALYHPCDRRSSQIASYLTAWLADWADACNAGGEFRLETQLRQFQPNTYGLTLSFLSRTPLQRHSEPWSQVPTLIIEIQAPGEQRSPLNSNIQQWLALGARVGILVHASERCVTVYHHNGDVEMLFDEAVLALPTLFPAWKLPLTLFWASESKAGYNNPS
jgi:hypothetical protein